MTASKRSQDARRRLAEQVDFAESSGAEQVLVKTSDIKELLRAARVRATETRVACEKITAAQVRNFWARVDRDPQPGGCWRWTKGKQTNGYGQWRLNGPAVLVHHISYYLHFGVIPDGLQLDHKCRQRLCVNPAHLEAVTSSENSRRVHKRRSQEGHG
jgi:hypothetical protein